MTINQLPKFTPHVLDLNRKTSTVTIQMDKKSVTLIAERTQDYKALPEKLRPAFEEIADYVTGTMIPRTFKEEGPGWKRLAKRTVREREAAGFPGRHPILRRSGDLYRELTDKMHPHHIEIIKVGKRARIEIGGSSKKFLENQLGNPKEHLPARPMIPGTGRSTFSERDRHAMSQIIERAYKRYIIKPR